MTKSQMINKMMLLYNRLEHELDIAIYVKGNLKEEQEIKTTMRNIYKFVQILRKA